MEDLLLVPVRILFEIISEFLLEILFELAAEALSALPSRRIPHRLFRSGHMFPGISLFIAPILTGFTMHRIGQQLRNLGREPSKLATFYGGAIFAFAMALTRFVLLSANH